MKIVSIRGSTIRTINLIAEGSTEIRAPPRTLHYCNKIWIVYKLQTWDFIWGSRFISLANKGYLYCCTLYYFSLWRGKELQSMVMMIWVRFFLRNIPYGKFWTKSIGGSRGGVPGARPPKGPDSFVLTYKIFGNITTLGVHAPHEVHSPPYGKSWIRRWNQHIFWPMVLWISGTKYKSMKNWCKIQINENLL